MKKAFAILPANTAGSTNAFVRDLSISVRPAAAICILENDFSLRTFSSAILCIVFFASIIASLKIPDLSPSLCIIPPKPVTTAPVTPISSLIFFCSSSSTPF